MRAAILTYHFSDNYGALLQAYSLREWLRRKDIEAEFVPYHPRYVEEGGAFDSFLRRKNLRKNLTIAYLRASNLMWSFRQNTAQRAAINEFRREYLGVREPRILSCAQMPSFDNVDLLICGSDQIWNPSPQRGLDPVYFLDFGKPIRARRISYAASFGTAELKRQFHAEAGLLIQGLDAVSVREATGETIVREVAGRKALCVPDPTVLLGDFNEILSGSATSSGHVLCYALRTARDIRQVAQHVGKSTNSKVLNPIGPRDRWTPIGTGIAPGPQEWLRLMRSASFVVSNSFHGVALSVVLNRPFIAVELPGCRTGLNERVINFLKQVGLADRLQSGSDVNEIDAKRKEPINWADVNQRLAALRECGERFLVDEINSCRPCCDA